MSYKVVWSKSASRASRSWDLSDQVFVEMRLQVERLSHNPAELLVRTTTPIDGMTFVFEMIDPANRLCVHVFRFHVVYAQDEERIFVARATHFRRIG